MRKAATPGRRPARGNSDPCGGNAISYYNNNPILKWCLTNTGVQTDRNGNIIPIKNQSPKQRIDVTVALLDCYVGLYEHYNEYTHAI